MFKRKLLAGTEAFTLIELIVVVSLISVMLFFAVPKMGGSFFANDARKFSGWLLANVRDLKSKSVEKQTVLALYVDLDHNQIWKGPAVMEEEDFPDRQDPGRVSLPEHYSLTGVIFSEHVRVANGIARIYFYPKAYSDRAIIHIRKNDGSGMSYRIESFLPHAKVLDGYEEF